ncbi:ABC-2 type transport system permease protein [Roseimicrobium gellanilyticum]|uniref:ABC-2 type transport system permease protein n=1 Tax=Roseimicrobium gellanilyticum TaxID=748857 RepID=A0A366HCR7_9BACT|nr:ABC transporter permease [Roseimicrobium gellanilyticum]RBP39770.1 ABC-2 type transport system permease protein [Roseimicrobium gellanilyticum]
MRLFFTQWGAEVRKMLERKRTYIGFGAFVVMELVIYWLLQGKTVGTMIRRGIVRQGESAEYYYSAYTLGMIVLALSLLLAAVFIALVAGDVVAKESEDGNLRMVLARPISRLRLLFIKFLSCAVFSVVLVQFLVWSVLLTGIALRGFGGGMIFGIPEDNVVMMYDGPEALQRYAMGSVGIAMSMVGVGSLAFMLSCFRIKPVAATISAVAYLLVDWILYQTRLLDDYRPWMLTHYMSTWRFLFLENIPWVRIVRNYSILCGASFSLFVVGAAVFESRDLKS